jgi:hypothetical protein
VLCGEATNDLQFFYVECLHVGQEEVLVGGFAHLQGCVKGHGAPCMLYIQCVPVIL